jgi:vitamin B12 transporter
VTDQLSFSSTLLYVGSWFDIGRQTTAPDGFNPYIKAPGFTTMNLAVNYALRDDMTLFVRIDNLFNRQYEDPIGFQPQGFGAFAGIRFTTGGTPSSGLPPAAASAGAMVPPSATLRRQGVTW